MRDKEFIKDLIDDKRLDIQKVESVIEDCKDLSLNKPLVWEAIRLLLDVQNELQKEKSVLEQELESVVF